MVEWINLLYSKAESCVKVNGVLTEPFSLERSVRQGCPMSALLYSISVEPLAIMVRADKSIKGIQIPNSGESVMHQYADDITFTLKDVESIKGVMKHIEVYGKASGAKINIEKSEIMSIGGVDLRNCDIPFKATKDYVNILGLEIGENARDATWTGVLNKVKQILQFWKLRELMLRGKVMVVNSLLLSKCNYIMGVVDLPQWVINEMTEITNNFMWGGKSAKIARKTLIANYKEGGLKLIDLEVKKKAIRVKMMKKYLCDKVEYGWKGFMKDVLDKCSGCGEEGLFMAMKRPMYDKVPLFYQEVLSAWVEVIGNIHFECENISQVLKQPIFLNPKIRMKGRVFYDKLYMNAGVRQIKDLAYEYVRGFLPNRAVYDCVTEWDDEIEMSKVDRMCENIKTSLPRAWVESIESETIKPGIWGLPELFFDEGVGLRSLDGVTTNMMYNFMLKKEIKSPASESVWPKVIPGLNVKKIWENLCVKYNGIECENLDFKLRHNRIYTKVVLHQINKNLNRECDVCRAAPETLMHVFLECKELDVFHEKLKGLIKDNWGEKVKQDDWKTLFLFGDCVGHKDVKVNLCNYVLRHARYAVWARRNLAFYEGKNVDICTMFKSVLRKNTYLMWKYLEKDVFEKAFLTDCNLINVDDGKKMYVNF